MVVKNALLGGKRNREKGQSPRDPQVLATLQRSARRPGIARMVTPREQDSDIPRTYTGNGSGCNQRAWNRVSWSLLRRKLIWNSNAVLRNWLRHAELQQGKEISVWDNLLMSLLKLRINVILNREIYPLKQEPIITRSNQYYIGSTSQCGEVRKKY